MDTFITNKATVKEGQLYSDIKTCFCLFLCLWWKT